ncbi:MAG: patatin family protein [Muribaculaceae bacterium]|nr:patatin family protein [Muribaculaceae bacterium]
MKKGLVLEGGAMRGLFSAGVMDVMMEHHLLPDGIIGVSAGACFGCNYKSGQQGRAIRYNKTFANDSRYSGLISLMKSGDIFNAEFAYHVVPNKYDIFDSYSFEASPIEYYVVCTDIVSGKPLYKLCEKGGDELFEWIRASASMPIVSNIVEIEGLKLLDGGMTDSIPLQYFEQIGYDSNVVILTQPQNYKKKQSPIIPLMRMVYRKYPHLVKAMAHRHIMYNNQLEYVAQAEKDGRCVVIRPEKPLEIGHISHNPKDMESVYRQGKEVAESLIELISDFWYK